MLFSIVIYGFGSWLGMLLRVSRLLPVIFLSGGGVNLMLQPGGSGSEEKAVSSNDNTALRFPRKQSVNYAGPFVS